MVEPHLGNPDFTSEQIPPGNSNVDFAGLEKRSILPAARIVADRKLLELDGKKERIEGYGFDFDSPLDETRKASLDLCFQEIVKVITVEKNGQSEQQEKQNCENSPDRLG